MNNINTNDYKNGIKLLKEALLKNGNYYSIANCKWVVELSKWLSRYNSCYLFWYNTIQQNCIHKIRMCEIVNDLFFDDTTCLFIWSKTKEKYNYWASLIERFTKYVSSRNPFEKKLNEINWHD